MNRVLKIFFLLGAVGVGAVLLIPRSGDGGEDRKSSVLKATRRKPSKVKSANRSARPSKIAKSNMGRTSVDNGTRVAETAVFGAQLQDEVLSSLAKSVMEELRRAIESNDLSAIRQIMRRMFANPHQVLGMSGIPRSIRRQLIRGLAKFGADGAAEILALFADEDPEIAAMAMQTYNSGIYDLSLSDSERADFVIAGAMSITDARQVRATLSAIYNMRHSVGVETMIAIYGNGTDAAREQLGDVMKHFTHDLEVTDLNTLRSWLEANPDGAHDDKFYGGFKVRDADLSPGL